MPAWIAPAVAAVGTGLSMAIAKGKDKRQLTQQEKLQALQMRGQKEMMDYGMGLQKEMWDMTGYGGQKKQMQEAGLNPGLMYGMGGGGGMTVGSPGTGGVGGAQAPSGSGRETEEMMGMGLQMASQIALMNAQKKNIDADTKLKLEGAEYTGGAQTGQAQAQTGKLNAETGNVKLEGEYLQGSMSDRLQKISAEATQAIQKAQQEVNNTNVSDRTKEDRIIQIKEGAIGQALDNALTRASIGKTDEEVKKIKAELKAIAEYVSQGWKRIDQEQQKIGQGERMVQQGWQRNNNDANRNTIMERLGNAGLDLQDRNAILQTITGVAGMGLNTMPKTTHSSWWSEDGQGNWNQGHSTQQR